MYDEVLYGHRSLHVIANLATRHTIRVYISEGVVKSVDAVIEKISCSCARTILGCPTTKPTILRHEV